MRPEKKDAFSCPIIHCNEGALLSDPACGAFYTWRKNVEKNLHILAQAALVLFENSSYFKKSIKKFNLLFTKSPNPFTKSCGQLQTVFLL